MFDINKPKPGTTKQTATGGTIVYHSWGLVHKAGNNYTGKATESKSKTKDEDDWDL